VGSAYLFGSGTEGNIFRRMEAGTRVAALGDASLTVQAAAERDGNGQTCSYAKIPAFSATSGSREISLRQPMADGLVMQSVTQHLARSAPK
jgi:acyl-CoA thioesterase FadM